MSGRSSELIEQLKVFELSLSHFVAASSHFSQLRLHSSNCSSCTHNGPIPNTQDGRWKFFYGNANIDPQKTKLSRQNFKPMAQRIANRGILSARAKSLSVLDQQGLVTGQKPPSISLHNFSYPANGRYFSHTAYKTSNDLFLDDLEQSLSSLDAPQNVSNSGQSDIALEFAAFSRQIDPKNVLSQREKPKKSLATATRIKNIRHRRILQQWKEPPDEEHKKAVDRSERRYREQGIAESSLNEQILKIGQSSSGQVEESLTSLEETPEAKNLESNNSEIGDRKTVVADIPEIANNQSQIAYVTETFDDEKLAVDLPKMAAGKSLTANGAEAPDDRIDWSDITDTTPENEPSSKPAKPRQVKSLTFWQKNISAVRTKYESYSLHVSKVYLHPKTDIWASEIVAKPTIGEMRTRWLKFNKHDLSKIWQNTMLHVLCYSPQVAPRFILATYLHGPQHGQLADVLDVLVKLKSMPVQDGQPSVNTAVWEVFRMLALHSESSNARISRSTVRFLVLDSPERNLDDIYTTLVEAKSHMSSISIVEIAKCLVNRKKFNLALHALDSAAKSESDVNSSEFRKVCRDFLQWSGGSNTSLLYDERLIRMLLSHEAQLDITLINTLIRKKIDDGKADTAWSIYSLLSKDATPPDDYTHLLLLRLCRKKSWHLRSVELMRAIQEKGLLNVSPALANEFLLSAQVSLELKSIPNKFHRVLNLYQMFWDMSPLNALGITDQHSQISLQKPKPPSPVLAVLVTSFIDTADEESVWNLYERFLELRKQYHPEVNSLASNHHVWDSFLNFQCNKATTSEDHWNGLLLTMSTPPDPTKPSGYCEPALKTFSIMISAFARSGNFLNAERMLNRMKQLGIEPSAGVWHSLIYGYSKAGNDFYINCLERMIHAGHRLNNSTAVAMSPIQDPTKLAAALLAVKKISKHNRAVDHTVWRNAIMRKISTLKGTFVRRPHLRKKPT